MSEMLKELAKRAEKQTPEQRATVKAALLKFAGTGKSKSHGEWIN